jgi:hypothetical protein
MWGGAEWRRLTMRSGVLGEPGKLP